MAAVLVSALGCSGDAPKLEPPTQQGIAEEREAAIEPAQPELLSSLTPEVGIARPWTGDLDSMIERGFIRALVVYSPPMYFFDNGAQRGIVYEALGELERFLGAQLGRRTRRVRVVILPVTRNEIVPALERGLADIAAANLTVTPERRRRVDFSSPVFSDVSEVIVTGPTAPQLASLDDLAGETMHVRRSSSYWQSLTELNRDFEARGLPLIRLRPAVEYLEDRDLLEMVNAGLLPMAVVDDHKVRLWAQVFDGLVVRDDLVVRAGGEIAWAFRHDSPKLADLVNRFIRNHRQGTLFGNVLIDRYLGDTRWIDNPVAGESERRYRRTVGLFEVYGERYGFDPLFLAAVGYQESKLDQSKRSRAGAVGVMQIKPATAADPNVGIPNVTDLENNIHAGAKYLAFLRDRYFAEPGIDAVDRNLLTLAAYNAGPARVRRLRAEAAADGFDPDVWFDNVEVIAARRIGRETVHYVGNISKYWVAYRLVENRRLTTERR